jgi:hypothetical protein
MTDDFEIIERNIPQPLPSEGDNRSNAIATVLNGLDNISQDDLKEIQALVASINRRKYIQQFSASTYLFKAYYCSWRLAIIYRIFAMIRSKGISAITINLISLLTSLL